MEANLESKVIASLIEKKATVATAESCTGGMVAEKLTSVSGASSAIKYSVVTYCNKAKEILVGVNHETLEKFGAVSEQTASEMAAGVRKIMGADIGVSVTGLAGPLGDEGKPVGLVYIGVSSDNYSAVLENHFGGDRDSVRKQAADTALELVLKATEKLGE